MAFKKGDFSVRLPGVWTGEAGKIADTLNDIIELSDKTAKEIERVSRVVGKDLLVLGISSFIYLWLFRIHTDPFTGSWPSPEGGRDHSCKRNL